ncbi:MAG: N-acetyl-gamma-glutamyl-phosphate reductase [Candidatus Hadarchaeota archaeon]
MIKVSIIGASGYTGGELLRLLATHPEVEMEGVYGFSSIGKSLLDVHPHLRGIYDLAIAEPDYGKIGKQADLVFVAAPHGVAMKFVPKLLEGGARVVDLGADYRLEDVKVFEKYYTKHESPDLKGVYGLPELHREEIKRAKLVANPGCFSVGAILSLAPLVKKGLVDLDHIVIDSKTGTSGAGGTPSERTHHPVAGVNVQVYAATTHRHTPEINQELGKLAGQKVTAHFTPHLIPIVRGILSTAHVFMKKPLDVKALQDIYKDFYSNEPFVRVVDGLPQVNFVVGSNYCDIGMELEAQGDRLVAVAAIDNLVKGAAGQAVQNMNVMFGFDEREGLRGAPLRP